MTGSVVLALLPAVLAALVFFGFSFFRILTTVLASAFLTEIGARKIFGKKASLTDGSAAVTGLLLAFLLSPSTPSWRAALASALAIFFGKEIFGGLGQNPFNPALVGAAFLWVLFPAGGEFFLEPPQTLGVQALAVMAFAGGVFLLVKRIILWETPLLYIGSVLVFSWALRMDVGSTLVLPSVLFAGFFLVTDPVTTPLTRAGQKWFAVIAGFFAVASRTWTSGTEGVVYGTLLANALNPWLDRWCRPRPLALR